MAEEKEPLTNQELVNQKIENIKSARENQEERDKKELERKLENLDFRRDYYMSELEKKYNMIPQEQYCKEEYEQITNKYNSIIDRMEVAEKTEEFIELTKEFEQYKSKRLSEKVVYNVLLVLFLLALGGFILYLVLYSRR